MNLCHSKNRLKTKNEMDTDIKLAIAEANNLDLDQKGGYYWRYFQSGQIIL